MTNLRQKNSSTGPHASAFSADILAERAGAIANLTGQSPRFLKAIEHVTAAARCEATVLVTGETGTGKELVSRAIHYLGPRAPFPFVAFNCGSLSDSLLEAELFGHDRGAYTDAREKRIGLILHAQKGTLFLDEVDALTLKAQVSLLRVLQDRRFRPLGSSTEVQADVRIVAATNTDLESRVRGGQFRADLYYRLRILAIDLPPLRDRREDIPLLAAHFLQKHAPIGRNLTLSVAAHSVLLQYEWPGNVRELENAIIRGCQLTEQSEISAELLGIASAGCMTPCASAGESAGETSSNMDRPFAQAKREVIASFERDYLTRLMAAHQGNVSRAARAATKERRELRKLLKKHHIDPKRFDQMTKAG